MHGTWYVFLQSATYLKSEFVFKLRVYDYAKLGVFYCNALYMLTQWLSYFINSGIFLDKDVFKIML